MSCGLPLTSLLNTPVSYQTATYCIPMSDELWPTPDQPAGNTWASQLVSYPVSLSILDTVVELR